MRHICPFCYKDPCGCILTEDDMKDYKIKDLEQKLNEAENARKLWFETAEFASLKKGELETQLSEALEVLRFYGDKNSWEYSHDEFGGDVKTDAKIIDDAEDVSSCEWYGIRVAGKRARAFLKKHGLEKV